MKNKSKKSTAERSQTVTEKDNAIAFAASKGKYKTLRTLMGAARKGEITLIVK